MSAEEYLAWHVTQDDRYEYVNGAPQLKHRSWDASRMMVGATQAHTGLCGNVYALLRERLRGSACRAVIADGKVVTPKGNYRYPDVAVDCGPYAPQSRAMSEPVAVVEIWSTSTRWLDVTLKLDDYRSVASIASILFLSQEKPSGQLWTRAGEWEFEELEGLDDEATLAKLGLTLPFRTLYEGLELG